MQSSWLQAASASTRTTWTRYRRSLERIQSAAATLLQPPCLRRNRRAFLSAAGGRRREWGRPVNDPTALTLREAATAISQGRLRAEALVEACLDRIERLQPVLNCFIRVTADAARAKARSADLAVKAGDALGPLHGVPLAHKDMFYRAGEVCTCGSKIRMDFIPDHTATVLSKLDGAGGIELGRLNMAEFAMGPTGHNDHFGRCRNPWNTRSHNWRFIVGLRRCRCRGSRIRRARLRHRGIGQIAGGGMRHRRHQADARPCQPVRNHAAVALARLHRRAGAQCRRLCAPVTCDRRS